MLTLTTDFADHHGKRALPPYQFFLNEQRQLLHGRYNALMNAEPYEAPAVPYITHILSYMDMPYMRDQLNNYDRYRFHIRHMCDQLRPHIDPVQTGKVQNNFLIQKGMGSTDEFIIPVADSTDLLRLPLHTEDWSVWKHVSPIRIWNHDSYEYTTRIKRGQIRFVDVRPSYCVFLLDVVALMFKFFIWWTNRKQIETKEDIANCPAIWLFINKYVICNFVQQLADIWLLNQLAVLMDTPEEDMNDFSAASLSSDERWGKVAVSCHKGFKYVRQLLHDSSVNLHPDVIFASNLLFSGSINDRLRLNDILYIPAYSQYDWLRWIQLNDTYRFYCKVWSYRPSLPSTRTKFKQWRREINRLINRRSWNYCNNTFLKYEIESDMTAFATWMENTKL